MTRWKEMHADGERWATIYDGELERLKNEHPEIDDLSAIARARDYADKMITSLEK